MTTGSVFSNDQVPATGGGWWGTYFSNSWNGADRVTIAKPPHNYYETYREYKDHAGIIQRKVFKICIPRILASDSTLQQNRVVKRQFNEEHAFTRSYMRRFEDRVSYNVPSNNTFWSDMTQHGAVTWAPTDLLDANDQIKLVGKMKDKLDGSDFNLGVVLGEMGPTLDLIGDTAVRMGKALGFAKHGQFGRAAEQLFFGTERKPRKTHPNFSQKYWDKNKGASEALASNWLELQYGWLPLLSDTEAGAQMLAHHLNVPMRTTYRQKVHREVNLVRTTQVGYQPSQQASGRSTRTHTRWLIARIKEKGSIPQLLGLANPELVLWELLPYSFVADWFIPIGSWMEARALVNRLQGTFITVDKKTGKAYTPESSYFAFKPRGNYFALEFSRTVGSTVKVPMPTFKPLGKVASWQHCANAVGLLITGFSGGSFRPKG